MSNPILNEKFAEREHVLQGEPMTINGTIQVTAFLGVLLVAAAAFVWSRFAAGYTDLANMLTFGGAIVGFILGLVVTFTRIKFLVPVYAVCEGLFLGGISAFFEKMYPGIVPQAVLGTFAVMFSMLALYRFGVIKCTDKFRSVMFIATASIAVIYLVDIIGHFFGHSVPIIASASNLGIGFTLLVIVIAALNFIIDFDFIERGSQMMLPKDMEWFGAFGLMVTLVWLYLEILRLLAKLQDRQ